MQVLWLSCNIIINIVIAVIMTQVIMYVIIIIIMENLNLKGLASYYKAETTFTLFFYSNIVKCFLKH